MKKILVILTLVAGLIGCKNQDISFPDFEYTAGYFPYQYPVRTLVLGNYIFPNEIDNAHKFLISAAMGGVYENTQDRVFKIELAPTLCDNVRFSATGDTIRLMPQSYYTLSSTSQLTIPAGKVNGGIEVKLADAFFDDPRAIKLGYVIPVRIVSVSNLDTVLSGKTTKVNPDPRVDSNWDIVPKNYTMFAVKFINPYHGKYLHRGIAVVKNAANTVLETTSYRQRYPENNEVWSLATTSKNQVTVTGSLRSTLITGTLQMNLTFAANGSCTITQATGSTYTITGTGNFSADAESWGGEKRDAIFINYQLTSGANKYFATDTLAIRDRAVVMEVYKPVVYTK